MQFRVIEVTDPHTNTHTHPQTGPITIHCTAASMQCNNNNNNNNSTESIIGFGLQKQFSHRQ